MALGDAQKGVRAVKGLTPSGRVDNLLSQYNEAVAIFDDREQRADLLIKESKTKEQKEYWQSIKDKAVLAKFNLLQSTRNFYKR